MSDETCFETREQLRARQAQEHHDKYEALAQRIGVEELVKLLPPLSAGQTWAGLLAADEYLNNVPLHKWDAAAGCPPPRIPGMHTKWPALQLRSTAGLDPWRKAPSLSLADRVCVLKHVARKLALETSTV